jgi:DNA invertase Pin-like site-specific DNA recombinase
MPGADPFVVGIMAMVAQWEREVTSSRTKAALAAAKARGVVMGGFRGFVPDAGLAVAARRAVAAEFADTVGPVIEGLHGQGLSLRQIAARLTERGVKTAKGGQWSAAAVRAVLILRESAKGGRGMV